MSRLFKGSEVFKSGTNAFCVYMCTLDTELQLALAQKSKSLQAMVDFYLEKKFKLQAKAASGEMIGTEAAQLLESWYMIKHYFANNTESVKGLLNQCSPDKQATAIIQMAEINKDSQQERKENAQVYYDEFTQTLGKTSTSMNK